MKKVALDLMDGYCRILGLEYENLKDSKAHSFLMMLQNSLFVK